MPRPANAKSILIKYRLRAAFNFGESRKLSPLAGPAQRFESLDFGRAVAVHRVP